MAHQHSSGRPYPLTWIILMILTAVSFGTDFLALGVFNTIIALSIAATKSTLVLVVFMHLRAARFSTKMVAMLSFAFVVLLCIGIYADIATR